MKKTKVYLDSHFKIGTVDSRIYGSFIEHLGRAVYEGIYQPESPLSDEDGFRKDVYELVKELNVPIVRYPGGNFVSGFRWEDSIGPKEKRIARPDLAWRVIESNQFGLDEFIDWTKKANTECMMAVNLGTRGVMAAKDLLEYCNFDKGTYYSDLRVKNGHQKPHDIKLWCLGNEMDGPWQEGHKTALEYGRLAAETGRALKMMDPTIETVACGSSSLTMSTFGHWEDQVLSECYDQVDYLSLHQYYGNHDNNTPDFLANTVAMDQFISQVISICDAVQAKKKSKKKINLSFDEWNVWYHSNEQDRQIKPWSSHPHQLEDIYNFEDALLVAGMLMTMLKHADRVKVACLAQLVNVIAPIMTSDTGVVKQTIFYPFQLFSTLGRGEVLHTEMNQDVYESSHGDAPYVDSLVMENKEEETLTFFVLNKDLKEGRLLESDIRQYEGYQVESQIVLHHEDLKAVNTLENPDFVKPSRRQDSHIENGLLQAKLLPQSLNVITLRKK